MYMILFTAYLDSWQFIIKQKDIIQQSVESTNYQLFKATLTPSAPKDLVEHPGLNSFPMARNLGAF